MCFWGPSGGQKGPKQALSLLMPFQHCTYLGTHITFWKKPIFSPTLFSSRNLSLTDTSLRIFSYLSRWIWNSSWDCSILGRVVASRGPRFSSSRSVRYASYSTLERREGSTTEWYCILGDSPVVHQTQIWLNWKKVENVKISRIFLKRNSMCKYYVNTKKKLFHMLCLCSRNQKRAKGDIITAITWLFHTAWCWWWCPQ